MATEQRQRPTTPQRSQGQQVARVNTDAFERGKIMSRAERELGKENPDAVRAAVGGELSAGVSVVNDKNDAVATQIRWIKRNVDAYVRNPTRRHYLNNIFGNPDAKPKPRGPNARAVAALRDEVLIALGNKVHKEDGVMFNSRLDGTSEEARILHDALYYAGEILPPEKRDEYLETPVVIRFLGGATVTQPIDLGAWLEEEQPADAETPAAPATASAEEGEDDMPPEGEREEDRQLESASEAG